MSLLERVRAALAPDYDVERELGRGGMGVVYLAREVALRRPVAVKVLRPELATAQGAHAFLREAQTLARIRDPHVLAIHRILEQDGLSCFIMEYMPGDTLHDRLRAGPLPPAEVRRLGRDLLTGLAAVHEAGIIHRDIKPGNIFLAPHGAVLGDFGIASGITGDEGTPSSTQAGAGTPDYMAPEQRLAGPLTDRTDLYQVGAVLFEAATGRRWFEAMARGKGAWVGVPFPLRRVLRRAVEWDEGRRWRDARAFGRALEGAARLPRRALLTLGAVLVLGTGWGLRATPAGPLEPRVQLTVLPFRGADSALARRLARYAIEPLERFARVRTRHLVQAFELRVPASVPEAFRLNTDYYAVGELDGDEDGAEVLALAVYDSSGRSRLDLRVPRGTSEPLAWGRAAADSLMARLFPGEAATYREMAGAGGSTDALAVDHFLLGVEAFQRDEYREGERRFREALSLDPGFAVAEWHLTLARRWLRTLTDGEVDDLLRRHRDRLPESYRLLLEAQLEPDLGRRFARYEAVIAGHPDNEEAVLLYADELFHRGALVGVPLDSALGTMLAVANRDPRTDQAPARDHTAWALIRLGRRDEARREVDLRSRTAAVRSSGQFHEGRDRAAFLRLAYDERFVPWRAELKRGIRFWDPDTALLRRVASYVRLGFSFDIPEAELALGALLVAHDSAGHGAHGWESQGLALTLLGRPAAALAAFDQAARGFRSRSAAIERLQWRLLPGALGLPALDSATVFEARRVTAQLAMEPEAEVRAAWTLGLEALARGDTTAAAPWLARLYADGMTNPRAARLALVLDGWRAATAQDFAGALALTAPLASGDPVLRIADPFARAALYLGRARWLDRLDRLEPATRSLLWHENSDFDGWGFGEAQAADVDGALGGVARLHRARLFRTLGRGEESCSHARRLSELWRRAEPAYAGLRQDVARLLAECGR